MLPVIPVPLAVAMLSFKVVGPLIEKLYVPSKLVFSTILIVPVLQVAGSTHGHSTSSLGTH